MKVLITGGAGFIGSEVVRQLIRHTEDTVINVDKLTYAGNLESLGAVVDHPRHIFKRLDICDAEGVARVLREHRPDAVMHLAAESHVDRSLDGPASFVHTNVVGTYTLLEAVHAYWRELSGMQRENFRFHHVSTDEVYGSLGETGAFDEHSSYRPNSPYAATKAASDHLVRAWWHSFGLPVIISNCSNNFGEYQYPEKLIPLMVLNAVEGRSLPIYGTGQNVRDWLYVGDHAEALRLILREARPGSTYNVGGGNERTNLEVVTSICQAIDELRPDSPHRPHVGLITHVADRPGHDRRYAIDAGRMRRDFGWQPRATFDTALSRTVAWYLENREWCSSMQDRGYRRERLGLGRERA